LPWAGLYFFEVIVPVFFVQPLQVISNINNLADAVWNGMITNVMVHILIDVAK